MGDGVGVPVSASALSGRFGRRLFALSSLAVGDDTGEVPGFVVTGGVAGTAGAGGILRLGTFGAGVVAAAESLG